MRRDNKEYYRDLYNEYRIRGASAVDADDRVEIKEFLTFSGNVGNRDAHSAIFLFCQIENPTKENIDIVRKYLGEDAYDENRQAALFNLVLRWNQNEGFDDVIIGAINKTYREDAYLHSSMRIAAASCVFEIIYRCKNNHLRSFIVNHINKKLDKNEIDIDLIFLVEQSYVAYSKHCRDEIKFIEFSSEHALYYGRRVDEMLDCSCFLNLI